MMRFSCPSSSRLQPLAFVLAPLLAIAMVQTTLPALAFSQPSVTANSLININASEQNFDADGTTHLKGNVRVQYLNYFIASSQATIQFSAEGAPSVATFFREPMPKCNKKPPNRPNGRRHPKCRRD
ncbi:MAG: hypothetical protein U0003_04630 [Vampirovibrionales bacterium]